MPFALSEEQQRAVSDDGGAVLVSAAAGSGKTRVLVERLLERVSVRGADIDRFLVITYTKAAAAELRQRIAQELHERLAQAPGDRHLRRQTVLIYRADISTVHAFCAKLLRENAAALDLDPDFRLCDEGEAAILKDQTLQRLMERRYEGISPEDDFAQLVDNMSAGRDDSRITQIVLDIYDRIQSYPNPEQWLDEQVQIWKLEGVRDAAQTPWGAVLMADAMQRARQALRRLERALELAQLDTALSLNYAESIQQSIGDVKRLLEAESWNAIRNALPVRFPAAGRKKGADEQIAARVKHLRARGKKQLDKLVELFEDTSEQLLYDLQGAVPAVRGLVSMVKEFGRDYEKEKRNRSLMDFSDLEHMAVRLLYDEHGDTTPLAHSWSERFDEVMVDEFQDTNQVQNAIFHALSGGGRTLFMVGDVKQSIYRFRLADPGIFLEYYRTFKPQSEARRGEARKLTLMNNFRSRPEVLAGVNDLFGDLMSTELGEVDYTEDQRLVPGRAFADTGASPVELHVVDVQDDEEAEGRRDSNLQEARAVAGRIRRMLDSGVVIGEGEQARPLTSSDIMLLLRSPGSVLHTYIRALAERGIAWSAEIGEDFFDSTEVNVALALLQIVDNPRQDVGLISALRSPVYAFSADRLAELRAGAKGDFYTAVEQAAQQGSQDCVDFLAELDRLRFGAGERTCSQLIWYIYQSTNLIGLFSSMSDGESRRAHLLTLYELARRQESAGCRTLFDFLLYLERLRKAGQRVPTDAAVSSGGVRIMSIHRSKGLEAPVVLVCGLGRQFNREDLKQPVLFHTKLGVGPKYLMQERGIELNTLARRAVALTLEREMMAEELRLLYVAMTRAQQKLILTMAIPSLSQTLAKLRDDADSPVMPQALAECPCVGQWILLSVLNRRSGSCLRELAGMEEEAQLDYSPAWDVSLADGNAPAQPAPAPKTETEDTPVQIDVEKLRNCFTWRYGHEGAVDVPSKITATQLKGRVQDEEAAGQTARPIPKTPTPLYRPQFAAEKLGLTPAQRGSALHLAMQFIHIEKTGDELQIKEEIERMTRQEFLTPLQGEAIDVKRLVAFFQSPLGRQMVASKAHREFKFSMLVPAEKYFPHAMGEKLLLQGVVDCWFEQDGGLVILDFKSDRVTEETVAQRAENYREQIITYAKALSELTGLPVKRRLLWFFALDRAVEI